MRSKTPLSCTLVVAALCSLFTACGGIRDLLVFSVKGEFVIGADGAVTNLVPDDCSPGVQQAFLGYDLYSKRDQSWVVRAVNDPINGPALRVTTGYSSQRHVAIFHQDECSVLQVSAHPSGLSVNDVDAYSGFVDVQCSNHDGISIEGRVDIVNCDSFVVNRAQPGK